MRTLIIFDYFLKTLFMKNFVSECQSSERIQISHWKDPDGWNALEIRTVHRKLNGDSSIGQCTNLNRFIADVQIFVEQSGNIWWAVPSPEALSWMSTWAHFHLFALRLLPAYKDVHGADTGDFLCNSNTTLHGLNLHFRWFTPSRITGIWKCCSDKPHPLKVFKKPDVEPGASL